MHFSSQSRISHSVGTLAALAVSAVLAAAHPALAAPTIVNGNFDVFVPANGTGGGWTSGDLGGGGGWFNVPLPDVSFGTYFSLNQFGEVATDPFISQLVTDLEIGHTYRITGDYENAFAAFGDPNALSFGVEIVELGLLTQLTQPVPDGSIGNFSIDFVATATSLTLRLTGERNGDDSSFAVDNIAIADITTPTDVPEPGTLGVLALGLLGLARLRRR
jgi:hypothetical protein